MSNSHERSGYSANRRVPGVPLWWLALIALSSLVPGVSFPMTHDPMSVEGGLIAQAPADETGVRIYKAIPFAAPPVANRRWQPPAAVEPWTGVRRSDEYALPCPQPELASDGLAAPADTSEDCLYLNIFTPARSSTERLPVFVWIHGGAYIVGSSREIDGSGLARRGVVVVTIGYRLGVFGFLAHPSLSTESAHGASGNYGIMDQIAALQWVHRNIAAFGGDPSRVTIGGSSAGATSVNVLMVSPLAKGLFQRAIGQSGAAMPATGLTDGSPLTRAAEERKGAEFVRTLGITSVEELRRLPAATLVKAGGARWETWGWNASIDGWVLPEPPSSLFARGEQQDVPLLAGWTSNEGASLARGAFGDDDEPFGPQIDAKFGSAAASILHLYEGGSTSMDRRSKVALAGDGFIAYPTWSWAVSHLRTTRAPLFLYVFDQPPPIPANWPRRVSMLGQPGAFHGSSQIYLFEAFASHPTWHFTAVDRRMGALMADYWAAFIREGDPNGPGRPNWPRYQLQVPRKIYFRNGHAVPASDAEVERLRALVPLFTASPGALSYRGMKRR